MPFVDVSRLPILEPRAGWLMPGQAAVVPAGEHHGVRAVLASRVIVVDYPVRASVGGADTGARGGA